MSKLTYKDDSDSGLIELFVDGVLFTTWQYEDEAELAFIEFKKIFEAGHESGKPKDSNQLKADTIVGFVNMMIGAFESGFVDTSTLNLQQLHRVAQLHVKDSYGIETKGIVEEWGRELAEECGLAKAAM